MKAAIEALRRLVERAESNLQMKEDELLHLKEELDLAATDAERLKSDLASYRAALATLENPPAFKWPPFIQELPYTPGPMWNIR